MRVYKPVAYRDDLTDWRMAAKMTQQQIAQKLGISRSTWQKYEYGKRKPSNEVSMRIRALMEECKAG